MSDAERMADLRHILSQIEQINEVAKAYTINTGKTETVPSEDYHLAADFGEEVPPEDEWEYEDVDVKFEFVFDEVPFERLKKDKLFYFDSPSDAFYSEKNDMAAFFGWKYDTDEDDWSYQSVDYDFVMLIERSGKAHLLNHNDQIILSAANSKALAQALRSNKEMIYKH